MVDIVGTHKIDESENQFVFVKITVAGDVCKYSGVAPAELSGQDLQDFVDRHEKQIRLDILRDMYGDRFDDLDAFEQWVADGAIEEKIDPDTGETYTGPAEKTPFPNNHPSTLSARQRLVKNVLHKKTPEQVDAWIDSTVTDLASAKTALKKMAAFIVGLAEFVQANRD